MTNAIKKTRIGLLVIFVVSILLLLFITPLNIYADTYDVGDTGPGGGIVFSALPNGLCKEALPYNDTFFCNWDTAISIIGGATINSYNDWRLPDIDELNQIYTNLHLGGLGNFSDLWYWSSTETGGGFFAYALNFEYGIQGQYSKGNEFYIAAVREFMGDPKNKGGNEEAAEEEIWVRNHEMQCFQVWVNEDNNFEFVFWWEYANNNHVQIYDMAGNIVWETDFEKGNSRFEAELPDGMYTVKTFHEYGHILQEFLIGKP